MKPKIKLKHEFVEFMPDELADDVIYVSVPYATVIHKCCCGCGNKVVTPLSPTDWTLLFNGETISLHPSIGNWNFKCKSHYWIQNNQVKWAKTWSEKKIELAREDQKLEREEFYEKRKKDKGEMEK
jgi:hypothetical protein